MSQTAQQTIDAAKAKDLKAQKTFDGFDNFVARLGLNNNNTLSAGAYMFNLMTRNRVQLEAAYRGSWIVGQVIDCRAEDMTRAGIDIKTNEAESEINDMKAYMSRLRIWSSLKKLMQWGDLYGGAIGFLQIEGQDPSTPLNLETITKNQFKGIAVYDRWQLNPDLTNIIKIGPDIGLPEFYYLVTTASTATPEMADSSGQVQIHHSRVIRATGIDLPFFQAITEMMWGESVLERLWDRLISYDTATMSTANLIERANNRTVGVDGFREILAAGGKALEALTAQFNMMREFQTNEGMTLMDKEDTFTTTNYTFSGLDGVLLQFGQQLSGAAEIPLVRLFGQSPSGLNSTGESDIRNYYDSINAKQEEKLRSGVELLLQVMWRSKFDEAAPEDLEFTFTPLWQMSAKDKADLAKVTTESVIGALDAGVISSSVAMKELRQSSSETGIFSNISDEEIEEAEKLDAEGPPLADLEPNDPLLKPTPEEPVKNLDQRTIWQRLTGRKKKP